MRKSLISARKWAGGDARIINVSVMGGFACGDKPFNGMAAVVTATQQQAADALATRLAQAAWDMHKRRVGAVLVTEDDNRLVGIFTGRDAVRCLAEGRDARKTKLHDVMTRDPNTLAPEQAAIEALRIFNDTGFRHLPVCRDGRVVCIVSRCDFRAMEQARLDEEAGFFETLR